MTTFDYIHDYKVFGSDYFEIECEECGVIFCTMHEWGTLCKACWKRSKSIVDHHEHGKEKAVPDEMLKRLIILCHPDRHDGSEMSLKATQFLLSLRS
jgi:hypothetical protein